MKTLVLGHRGASAYAPENTLAAFNLAFEMGADGIELDVTLTKDGVPVVIHDDTVDRTTNGTGAVKALTLAQLKQLDASYTFEKYRGEKIPTLEEVLNGVGKRGMVNIELKSTQPLTIGLERAVGAIIAKTGTAQHVLISSFDRMVVHRMQSLNPDLPHGLLYDKALPANFGVLPQIKLAALHPKYTSITPVFVAWAKQRGYQINTWTVNDPGEAKRLRDLGVDAVITNKPDVLRQVIG